MNEACCLPGWGVMVTYILMSCGFFTTSGRELEREEEDVNEISTLKVNLERRQINLSGTLPA